MTIALGILAKDGVVIAADTQETYTGVFKMDQSKILGVTKPTSGFMVSGAGSAGHLDSISQALCDDFFGQEPTSLTDVEHMIASRVHDFHLRHIAPFGAWPDFERPSCSLVIGARRGSDCGLWITDKSTVHNGFYGAVGIGAAHANLLLGRLWREDGDADFASLLAAYVVYHVKQHVDGCGSETNVVGMSETGTFVLEPERVELLEREFKRLTEKQDLVVQYILRRRGARRHLNRLPGFLDSLHGSIVSIHNTPVPSPDEKRPSVREWVREGHRLPESAGGPKEPIQRPAGRPAPQGSKRDRKVRPPSRA